MSLTRQFSLYTLALVMGINRYSFNYTALRKTRIFSNTWTVSGTKSRSFFLYHSISPSLSLSLSRYVCLPIFLSVTLSFHFYLSFFIFLSFFSFYLFLSSFFFLSNYLFLDHGFEMKISGRILSISFNETKRFCHLPAKWK